MQAEDLNVTADITETPELKPWISPHITDAQVNDLTRLSINPAGGDAAIFT